MKRIFYLPAACMLAVCLLAMTACASEPAQNQTAKTTAAQTTALQTTAAETTAAPETTTVSVPAATAAASTASAASSVSTALTTASAVQNVTETYADAPFVPAYTVTNLTGKPEQGGNGGEEHAQDIDPLYFNYLFGETEAALRLAGGTYQVLSYDFSEALENDVESKYYLEDADFDGDLDLCVPVHFSGADTEQAVFLWNAETLHYEEMPVMMMNPVFRKEKKQIICTENPTEKKTVVKRCGWENGSLKTLESAAADFRMLTYVFTGADGKKDVQKPETEDALKALMDAFLA